MPTNTRPAIRIGWRVLHCNLERKYIPHQCITVRICVLWEASNVKDWDTSNRAINVIINNLKGIFFDDDNFEHMACGIVADWGEPGRTEVRICDFEELKKCEIFR